MVAELLLGFLPVSVVQGLRSVLSSGLRLHPLTDAEHTYRKGGRQHEQRNRASITRHDRALLLPEHRDNRAAVYGVGSAAQQVGIRYLRLAIGLGSITRQVQRVRTNQRSL